MSLDDLIVTRFAEVVRPLAEELREMRAELEAVRKGLPLAPGTHALLREKIGGAK